MKNITHIGFEKLWIHYITVFITTKKMTFSDLYLLARHRPGTRESREGGDTPSKTFVGGGGRWWGPKSHLIANKSQKALKNCCLSFTFQFYKETIFLFHPSQLSVVEKKNLHY